MNTTIEQHPGLYFLDFPEKPVRLYNPGGMDFQNSHRIKCIELGNGYTRIDFIYRSSARYVNGGWIQMDPNAWIQPVNSGSRYRLLQTIGIPLAPTKHFFRRVGQFHPYTLIFPSLPKNTTCIDIVEKEAPGNYFNFYGVDFSEWMTVCHPVDLPLSHN